MSSPPSALTLAITENLHQILAAPPDPRQLEAALRLLAKWRAQVLEQTLVKRDGVQVQNGPFQGMTYAVRASEGGRVPRMLGSYEASLAPVLEQIIARAYPLVIDVGSAEGYYAVGLARRMPGSQILARDDNPTAQALCAQMAQDNGVADRVQIGGRMDWADFGICTAQDTVVICDIEGEEAALLDPARAPGLLACDLLVEVHEGMKPGLTAALTTRFAASHAITRLDRVLDATGLPTWMETLSDIDRLLALWEWRAGPTPWLWMTRKP